jgi:DNA-binding CsgD family transcriptional regulator
MNAITMAMHNAGVQLPPLNKRVWLWLNDHPGKTSKQIAIALGEKHSNVATTLGQMVKRRMVQGTKQQHPHRNVQEWHYETCIKQYELLPMRKAKPQPKPKVDVKNGIITGFGLSAVPVSTETVASLAVPLSVASPFEQPKCKFNLDDLTVREARALYEQLHKMFGGKS